MPSSVADLLKAKDREYVLSLSPAERIELAERMGDEDLALFCAAQGLTLEEGRLELQRRRQAGRRPCGCIEELLRMDRQHPEPGWSAGSSTADSESAGVPPWEPERTSRQDSRAPGKA